MININIMKTQNSKHKLAFGKNSVIELQNHDLSNIHGGTMTIPPSVTIVIAELTKQLTCGGGEDSCVTR